MKPLLLLLLSCLAVASATRDGVFVGYKEAGVVGEEGGEDGSLNAVLDGGDGGNAADDAAAATLAAEAVVAERGELRQAAEETGRTVVLYTQFGPMRVQLLEKLAPRTTALVWALAANKGCKDCAFYRNEAKPHSGLGPPYALLQGRMPELAGKSPREGNIEVKMGHVCFIPETKDFFIAYGDHPEWETSHTVWGVVDEWFATDLIVAQQYKEVVHSEFGTHMRMLKVEVPFKMTADGDKTYSGMLGPMH